MDKNGFNSHLSLLSINGEELKNVEKYTNEYLADTIAKLICCQSNIYKSQIIEKQFQFAPGHRVLILSFPKQLEERMHKTTSSFQSKDFFLDFFGQLEEISTRVKNEPALSNVLKELVKTALNNFGKPPNRNEYSETMKYFSAYIYMICGRKCYEILQSNLSMPAVSTVCMSF